MSEYRKGFEVGLLAGHSFEQERIIALLEAEAESLHASHMMGGNNDTAVEQRFWRLIAVIRESEK